MDHHARVRQGVPVPRRPGAQEHRRHGLRVAQAHRVHRGADVLHDVVDGQAGGDHAAAAVDVQHDGLLGVHRVEEQELADDAVRALVVHAPVQKHPALAQELRVEELAVGLGHGGRRGRGGLLGRGGGRGGRRGRRRFRIARLRGRIVGRASRRRCRRRRGRFPRGRGGRARRTRRRGRSGAGAGVGSRALERARGLVRARGDARPRRDRLPRDTAARGAPDRGARGVRAEPASERAGAANDASEDAPRRARRRRAEHRGHPGRRRESGGRARRSDCEVLTSVSG